MLIELFWSSFYCWEADGRSEPKPILYFNETETPNDFYFAIKSKFTLHMVVLLLAYIFPSQTTLILIPFDMNQLEAEYNCKSRYHLCKYNLALWKLWRVPQVTKYWDLMKPAMTKMKCWKYGHKNWNKAVWDWEPLLCTAGKIKEQLLLAASCLNDINSMEYIVGLLSFYFLNTWPCGRKIWDSINRNGHV
jgi:hypothetical protein